MWLEVLLATLLVAYIVTSLFVPRILARPSVQTLSEFLQNNTYSRVISVSRAGSPYTVVVGKSCRFLIDLDVPGYVFDGNGKLVDWTYHIGDQNEFLTKWRSEPSDSPPAR